MIKANEKHFPVGLMCRTLSVSRSGYYGRKQRPGAPRVARRLQDEGKAVGRNRIARIMWDNGWAGEGGQEIQGNGEQPP